MGLRIHTSDLPTGYAPSPSGLALPVELTRTRETWTHDQWRLIDRASKLLASRDIKLQLVCGRPECDGVVSQVKGAHDPTLQCGCKTRVFLRDV